MEVKQTTIQVKMFGEFFISNEHHAFPREKKKSLQIGMLMAYLLANRNLETSKNKLIEILWPNEESDHPEGALRNLVYRARMEMKKFFPGEDRSCILLHNNSYQWDYDTACSIDVDQFEEYCKLVSVEREPMLKYEYCQKAMALYKGDFLPEYSSEEWVVFRSAYYKRLYGNCLLDACLKLTEEGLYQEVLNLCDHIIVADQLDSRVYECKLTAYLELGNPQSALSYYNQVVDLSYSKMGVNVSERMKELYQQILDRLPNRPTGVEELAQQLKEEQGAPGTFYCNYDVFKNIYQINVRAARRALRARFFVLLTLDDPSGLTSRLEEESNLLKQIISSQLRKNDVFSQYNTAQYLLILAAQNQANCQKAIDRIIERFYTRSQEANITLSYQVKQID